MADRSIQRLSSTWSGGAGCRPISAATMFGITCPRVRQSRGEGRQVHLRREGHRRAAEICHAAVLGDMRSIEFNPDWTVPDTIKFEDLAPRLRQGSADGTRDISILPATSCRSAIRESRSTPRRWTGPTPISGKYTFTQEPRPDNVLGKFKFNFPNRHAIYMHDTIQPELFSETVRWRAMAASACDQPARLAALLLAEDKGWSPAPGEGRDRQRQEQRRDAEPQDAGAPHLFHRDGRRQGQAPNLRRHLWHGREDGLGAVRQVRQAR